MRNKILVLGLLAAGCTVEGDNYHNYPDGNGGFKNERTYTCDAIVDFVVDCGYFQEIGLPLDEGIKGLTRGCEGMRKAESPEFEKSSMNCVYDSSCNSSELTSCFTDYEY